MSKGGFVGEEVSVALGVVVSVRVDVEVGVWVCVLVILAVGVRLSVLVCVGMTTGVVDGGTVSVAVGSTGGCETYLDRNPSRIKPPIKSGIQTLRRRTRNGSAGTIGLPLYPRACKSWFRLAA